jgi:hypothetical protein
MDEIEDLTLSPFLQAFYARMASVEFVDFFRERKLNEGLFDELKIALVSVDELLEDAEEKHLTNPAVKEWLHELKDAVYDLEDILDEIATKKALQSMSAAEFQTSASASKV